MSGDTSDSDTGGIAERISRRDVLKAASTSALASSAITGVVSAQSSNGCGNGSGPCSECRDTGCRATRGSCTPCLTGDCDEIAGSRIEVGGDRHCVEVPASEIPDGAGKAVIKAANECHECDVADPSRDQTFCVGSKHAISHVEFAACPGATVTAACEDDVARVDVHSLDGVYYEVSYSHCDADDDSGRLTGSGDRWSATVPIANCEGTVAVYAERGGERLDEVAFDCETASVSVDCPAGEATIAANDSSRVFYEIDYAHCDADDVSRTSLNLTGAVDSVSIPVADCEGTITLTDDDGTVLDETTVDCESAGVSVDCVAETATISAPDTEQVWYAVDYVGDCPTDDVSRTGPLDLGGATDAVTVDLPGDCAGTITVTDDDERGLASADFDCSPRVTDLAADCERVVATFDAPAVGDAVVVDVEAVAADGSTVGSVSSDRVTVERVEVTTGEVAVEYGSAIAASSWDAVDVQVTHVDLGRVVHSETVSMDGSCGCRECSSDLDVKFEGGDLRECSSLNAGGATFTVTDVETKRGESSGEVMSVCFATEQRFCELDVAVKAGPHVGSTTVTPTTGGADGDCPGVDAGAAEFCVDVSVTGQRKNAISWVTIRCP